MNLKNRFYAFGIHVLFSFLLLILALLLVFKLWYPAPLDQAMGVTEIFWFILGVDLILGPLLTFVVFNPKKKELKRDLIIIIVIQIAAYIYGLYTVAQGRPVWQVFVVDDIELVRAIDIQGESSVYPAKLFSKPQWVAAVYSENPEIANKQKQAEMFEGVSLASRPETYQPLKTRKSQIGNKLKKLELLQQFNSPEQVRVILDQYPNNIVGYLPVKGFSKDMVALFDYNFNAVAIVDLRPWSEN